MTLRLVWATPDAEGTAMRLASVVGGHVDRRAVGSSGGEPGGTTAAPSELVVPLVGGDVVIVPSPEPDRLLLPEPSRPDDRSGKVVLPGPEAGAAVLRGAPALLGLGWATVDAERALPAVANAVGLPPAAFRRASDDESLGASALVGRLGALAIAILEPTTEGRVAAALARSGEGPCAIYVATASSAASQPGPLGPAILAMADRRWGPFVVAVRRRVAAPR